MAAVQYRAHKGTIIGTRKRDDSAGVVEAIVSAYDVVDSWNTRFLHGAFADYDRANSPDPDDLPRVVWGHDWNRFAGKVVETAELAPGDKSLPEGAREHGGWFVQSEFALRTVDGADLYEHLAFGSVTRWSHGFDPIEEQAGTDGVHEFTRVKVYEVSPVLVPANTEAVTMAVRGRYAAMTIGEKIESLETAIKVLEAHALSYADMRAGRGVSASLREQVRALAGAARRVEDILSGGIERPRERKARNILRDIRAELNSKGIYNED